jgi:hypothetical protein
LYLELTSPICISGPLEESAIWIDEIPPEELRTSTHGRSTTQSLANQDPLGIIKESARYSRHWQKNEALLGFIKQI